MIRRPFCSCGFVVVLWAGGCVHLAPSVAATAQTREVDAQLIHYRDALRSGNLPMAYGLTSNGFRASHSYADFAHSFARPEQREARALLVEGERERLELSVPELSEDLQPPPAVHAASRVLEQFLDATERRDFATAYRLLGSPWRSAYSPERLAADFDRTPQVRQRLKRARAALLSGLASASPSGDSVRFPVEGQQQVLMVQEADGYHVGALE